jgi:hypothetical protein
VTTGRRGTSSKRTRRFSPFPPSVDHLPARSAHFFTFGQQRQQQKACRSKRNSTKKVRESDDRPIRRTSNFTFHSCYSSIRRSINPSTNLQRRTTTLQPRVSLSFDLMTISIFNVHIPPDSNSANTLYRMLCALMKNEPFVFQTCYE